MNTLHASALMGLWPGLTVSSRCRGRGWAVAAPVSGSTAALAVGEHAVLLDRATRAERLATIRRIVEDAFLVAGHDAAEMLRSAAPQLKARGLGGIGSLTLLGVRPDGAAPSVESAGVVAAQVESHAGGAAAHRRWSVALDHPVASLRASMR